MTSRSDRSLTDRGNPPVHNFFDPQPLQKPAVFFLRVVLHDWSDEVCITILRHLRAAAAPDTQLVIVDNIVGYACPEPAIPHVEGAAPAFAAPAPLLPYVGTTPPTDYLLDLTVRLPKLVLECWAGTGD